ncbi:MAG: universal stress protein [Cyclobacteriaceae bacterium]|nr:universal stress protein [Cyclobacteriaceae bacterium SS2]
MKTILVATDFSAPANNAVDYASHLAKETGAELILFSVHKLSTHASNSLATTTHIDDLLKKKEDQLLALAQKLSNQFGISVRWELKKDDPILDLKNYTKTHPVDLVVMGIESNLIEYKLLGNTTTAAIKLLQFPLLVVPNDIDFTEISNVMYACESSYLKNSDQLDFLKQFLKAFNAKLEVFHVLTKDSEELNDIALERILDNILKDIDHSYRYVCSPKVGDGIKDGLEHFHADLLVMIPHRRGFFQSIFHKSHTSQMTVETRIPLLTKP